MYLVIDNYDSFVHNLTRYFVLAGQKCRVVRNDAITLDYIRDLKPEAIILSPGPCTPAEAGICVDTVKIFAGEIPILGICLGHQAIGEAYGCKTSRAKEPVHGMSSIIKHDSSGMFKNLPSPLQVGRYHSLIVEPQEDCPLLITAETEEGEIMAMRHESAPVYGLQFHPESILTPEGLKLIENFTEIVHNWYGKNEASKGLNI